MKQTKKIVKSKNKHTFDYRSVLVHRKYSVKKLAKKSNASHSHHIS